MTERDIFTAAREIADPAARSAYLDRACDGDAGMRARVEALLRAHDQPDSLLDHPALSRPEPGYGPTQAFSAPDSGRESNEPAEEEVPLGFLEPPTRPDAMGRLGHYEMLQVLGKGGFGIVFRAFDETLQRVVAVKVMAPQIAMLSPARKRFLREARSSAAVRHENVVQVYEVGEQPLPYLAMEFVPGETLQQKLDRSGPLDVAEVLRIGRQVAEGLAAAHACDLIHRDIKPANVLIEGGPQQRAKITDFGLARAADDASISQSGVIAGTPMYMAPEQALGHKLDQRADLFSLGSVLYQMVSGRPPFRAPSTLAVLKRVAEESPRPIPEIIPETPVWLCAIIAKLHAKNPKDRFQSAREVADLLADCEAKLKANSKLKDFYRIPAATPTPRRTRRWQWAAAASLVVVLSGLWFGHAAMLYLANAGEMEILPQQGLVSVIVLQDGDDEATRAAVTDWLDMKSSHTFPLPPGRYLLNAGAYPAGRRVVQWEVTTSGPFGSSGLRMPAPSVVVTVERGKRVTVRAVIGDAPPTPNSPKETEGWVSLFNGKDLTGWNMRPGKAGNWQVVDGVLVGSKDFECLFSARDNYQNFHLRAEAAIGKGGLGFIWFRAGAPPEPPNFNQKEIGYTASVQDHGAGSISFQNPQNKSWTTYGTNIRVKPDEWFTLEVIAAGDHLVTKVNGVTTEDVLEPLDAYKKGYIALQLRLPDSVMRFRKIEIKELPPISLPSTFKNSIGMELR